MQNTLGEKKIKDWSSDANHEDEKNSNDTRKKKITSILKEFIP